MSITMITGEDGWPMSGANVSPYIAVFEKQGEAHLRDLPFVHLPTFQMLRKIFSSDADDPMYDEYQIDARIANRLVT